MGAPSPAPGPEVVLRAAAGVVFRDLQLGQGGVLLHVDTAAYHGVNAVGALAFGLVDGRRSVAEVVEGVRAGVADPPVALPAEVTAFLGAMLARGLLERVP